MGWLGFLLVGGGVISVWAGFQGVKITDVVSGILQGKPIAKTVPGDILAATPGSTNSGSGLEPSGSGSGAAGSAGGGVSSSSGGAW